MPRYLVKDGHKKYEGKRYAPGDTMECSEDVAHLLRLEAVKEERMGEVTPPIPPVQTPPAPPVTGETEEQNKEIEGKNPVAAQKQDKKERKK